MSQACSIIGVSEAALRQWTDEGKIKAFITPGGHRRYQESELKLFLRQQRHVQGLKDLGERLESVVPKERQIAHEYMQMARWYSQLGEDARMRLRERGRRLVSTLVRFVNRPSIRDQAIEECRSIGREYGEDLAKSGLSLTDALEAFIAHRNPVSEAVIGLLSNNSPINKPALAAIPQINRAFDEMLLALVEAHRTSSQSNPAGGNRP